MPIDRLSFRNETHLIWGLFGLASAFFLMKLWLASFVPVIWDEAHYWVLGLHPALGYSEVAAGLPLLIRLGVDVFGDTVIGMRLFLLLCSTLTPLGVWLLARALGMERDALWAAGLALLLPLAVLPGVYAFPDAGLQPLVVFTLAFAVRALQHDQMRDWVIVGLIGAIGFFFHYRYALIPLALFCFTLLRPATRMLWQRKGLYIAGIFAALGLLPVLLYNIQQGFAPLIYQLSERHTGDDALGGLVYPLAQVGSVTPFYFAGLVVSLVLGYRKAQAGDLGALLVVTCSAVVTSVYWISALFGQSTLYHWPFIGYVPLIVFLPEALRLFAAKAGAWRRWAALSVPLSGAAFTLLGFVYVTLAAKPGLLPNPALARFLQGDFEDWSPIVTSIDEIITEFPELSEVPLIIGHHRMASLIQFSRSDRRKTYTLWHPDDVKPGFAATRASWQEDTHALLRDHAGREALFISQQPGILSLTEADTRVLEERCALFEKMGHLGDVSVANERHVLHLYRVRVKPSGGPETHVTQPLSECSLIPRSFLVYPRLGETISGEYGVLGWSAIPGNVSSVRLKLNDHAIDVKRIGLQGPNENRPGLFPDSQDYPKVYFWEPLKTQNFDNGAYDMSVEITNKDGDTITIPERRIYIAN